MSTTLKGDLHHTDYSDSFELARLPRTYTYSLSASDGGKVSLKIETYAPALLGESGGGHWYTTEEKSKIASGTTLNGEFTVGKTALSSSSYADYTTIKITFSRELASDG